jgi:predicted transcriptional regulator
MVCAELSDSELDRAYQRSDANHMESDEHEVADEGGASSLGSSAQKVIQFFLCQGVLTQGDLSGETGLSRSTVANVLGSLGSSGLVVPLRGGRPRTPSQGFQDVRVWPSNSDPMQERPLGSTSITRSSEWSS